MNTYARTTSVPVERTRAEIEHTVVRYGATAFAFATEDGDDGSRAAVQFVAQGRRVRFILPLPARSERRFTHTPSRGVPRGADAAQAAWEQECRQRWRGLLLLVKALLEAVESGVVLFEDAFLPYTVVPGTGMTVAEQLGADLTRAIETGIAPSLVIESPHRA